MGTPSGSTLGNTFLVYFENSWLQNFLSNFLSKLISEINIKIIASSIPAVD